jgi:hypothetical integral membrane protein (TIGR02206 family)
MVTFISIYLGFEVFFLLWLWIFDVGPVWERFPLHLCGSLSLLMPVLILTKSYNWLRFFGYWSISAGFISYVNPSFGHTEIVSFDFLHYLVRHYFLFLIPIFLQIGYRFKLTYRGFLVSMGSLAAYAFVIFLFDWATGANFMYLGQENPLEVPFLPNSFTAWPWVYPSFVGVGIVLLHLAFLSLRWVQRGNSRLDLE